MKVLTIKQPFASLIMAGIKEYEFRTWKTKYRGRFLIHAGKGLDKKAMEKYASFNLEYPSGCIIGSVDLVDCIPITDDVREQLALYSNPVYDHIISDKKWNGYGFKLKDPIKIDPIEVNGKLSFWEYDI